MSRPRRGRRGFLTVEPLYRNAVCAPWIAHDALGPLSEFAERPDAISRWRFLVSLSTPLTSFPCRASDDVHHQDPVAVGKALFSDHALKPTLLRSTLRLPIDYLLFEWPQTPV
jgi:hypothetical protein